MGSKILVRVVIIELQPKQHSSMQLVDRAVATDSSTLSTMSCWGVTRASQTCKRNADSALVDASGRLVGGPLRFYSPILSIPREAIRKGPRGRKWTHGAPFLDLETTGTDVSTF